MKIAATIALALSAPASALFGQPAPQPAYLSPTAPPPAPPPMVAAPESGGQVRALSAGVYSIGDPTPEEQLYVEMINRARANAQAEAVLLANTTDADSLSAYSQFGVDLELMITQFAQYGPAQPLAINARLTEAARRHSTDMLVNAFQGHTGSDGSSSGKRVTDAGYAWFTVGENVYASARSVLHGHAGFEVDWGPGVGGMQTPPGHRDTIHRAVYREIGVGVVLGTNEREGRDYGPQSVTQNFATAQNSTPFVTGVVYYDLNGNSFYDAGEGIGGISVEVSGVATKGITALSGGYAVPVSGNGAYTVTFSGAGLPATTRPATVANQSNFKVDFTPVYAPPMVNGPDAPAVGRANGYAVTVAGGATEYQWRSFERVTARGEGAETGTENITIDQTAGYDVIQTQIKTAGSSAFHFAHPQSGARPQSVTLKPTYALSADSSLRFQSRLGWAGPAQVARVQISTDGGATWTSLFSQAGSGNSGESSFTERTVDLAAFAGRQARLRFVYDISSGSFFPQTDAEVGWYVDDIRFSNVDETANEQTAAVTNGAFDFVPAREGTYVLQARARAGHRFLEWGPTRVVQAAVSNTLEMQVSRIARAGAEIQLTVDLLGGTAGALALESKASLTENWAAQAATIEPQSSTRFLIRVARSVEPARFYRVRSN